MTEEELITHIHIGRCFHAGSMQQQIAGSGKVPRDMEARIRNAGQRLLRAGRDAARDMDAVELWAHVSAAASSKDVSTRAVKLMAADVIDTIRGYRKEQGR